MGKAALFGGAALFVALLYGHDQIDCRIYADNDLADYVLADGIGRGCHCISTSGTTTVSTDEDRPFRPFPSQLEHPGLRRAAANAQNAEIVEFELKTRWGELPKPRPDHWCGQSLSRPIVIDDSYALVDYVEDSGIIGVYGFEKRDGKWFEVEHIILAYW